MQCEPKVHVNALNEVARQPAKRLHTIPLRFFSLFLHPLTPTRKLKKMCAYNLQHLFGSLSNVIICSGAEVMKTPKTLTRSVQN